MEPRNRTSVISIPDRSSPVPDTRHQSHLCRFSASSVFYTEQTPPVSSVKAPQEQPRDDMEEGELERGPV